MNSNFKKGTIIITTLSGVATAAYQTYRKHRQKKIQKRVNETAPTLIEKDDSVEENNIQLTVIEDNQVDLRNCQESPMSENEIKEWEALISTIGGETIKTALTASAFDGLLRCDVPLKDLCRIKGDPNAMRGLVINDDKISRHASFSEPNLGNAAPLLVYQCMAIITSQYYQQIITDKLNFISTQIDQILSILKEDDRAKLKVTYNRLVKLTAKNSYDYADKAIVSDFLKEIEIVREKYKELLLKIKHINVNHCQRNKEEAKSKIQSFEKSCYFEYLEMVMQAEALSFIASAVSIKIAKFLGNEEDIKIYADINLDYWHNYVDQFNKIKHDVIKYLELEASDSLIHKKSITLMKKAQLQRFNKVEKAMLELQKQFEYKTTLYIKQEDGKLKKYISLSES